MAEGDTIQSREDPPLPRAADAGLDIADGALASMSGMTSQPCLNSIVAALMHTPGGAFGSARYKMKGIEENRAEYERLIEVFRAHDIGYFFYNGGNDSMDTAHKVSQIGKKMGFPVQCIGVPKTIDNDLPVTDNCPGFGSVAKYVAVSTIEASLDVESMASSSTKVFILEVMGRHAGWIAAAAGLAAREAGDPPHLILFPEVPFKQREFLRKVKNAVETHGYCSIVVSEGVRDRSGKFLADQGLKHVLCTDIGRDGAMTGPNVGLYRDIAERYPKLEVQASGGVSGLKDLAELAGSGAASAITGKALLEGAFTVAEAVEYLK